MMIKAGITGNYCTKEEKRMTPDAAPEDSSRSASPVSVRESPAHEKGRPSDCGNIGVPEIQPSDEISMMRDMLVLAGIEGRDASALLLHLNKASNELNSGNRKGFEAEAELFYMEFDRIYYDETECIFHSY